MFIIPEYVTGNFKLMDFFYFLTFQANQTQFQTKVFVKDCSSKEQSTPIPLNFGCVYIVDNISVDQF